MIKEGVTVYYSFHKRITNEPIINPPIKLLKYFGSLKSEEDQIYFCPSILPRMKRTFFFKALTDIEINKSNSFREEEVIKNSCHIMLDCQLFLFALEPLEVLISDPFFHIRENKGFVAVPSMLDIGQRFRPIEFSFLVFADKLKIPQNEPLLYLEFLTSNKINFKEFNYCDKYAKFMDTPRVQKFQNPKYLSLEDRYKDFDTKRSDLISLFEEEERLKWV